VPQVFEYLTTDLKRYMDRNGKGPAYPLTTQTVKVRASPTAGRTHAPLIPPPLACVLHPRTFCHA
jgi:hypothetical protein